MFARFNAIMWFCLLTPGSMRNTTTPPPVGPLESRDVSLWNLFSGYVLVGLFGFGGISASMYFIAVEKRAWVTAEEYTTTLALGQVLPGPGLMNTCIIVADKFHGIQGVLLALIGLLLCPILILLGLVTVYDHYAYLPEVQHATYAAAAASVGLIFGMGLKLGKAIIKRKSALLFMTCSFIAIGVLKWPLFETMLVLAAVSILVGYKEIE